MYVTFLKDLIAFKSVTPQSNGAVEYVEALLKKHNFKTEIKVFGDSKEEQVTNLYAVFGSHEPNICFVGHVDVVPAGDCHLWHNSDPFKALEKRGKLYGRGTVDMKGAIACFLAAALDLITNHPDFIGSVSFLLTSDEEGVAKHGTKEMLQYMHDQNYEINFAVIGEPTCEKEIGDTIKIGRRGSVNFKLMIKGLAGHVAYPQKAKSPLPCLIKILNELTDKKLDGGTEFFQSSNLEVTNIEVGNSATNVIPAKAEACFNVRFNNLQTVESLNEHVENVVKRYCKEYMIDYKLQCDISAECFIQKPNEKIKTLADVVERVLKINPEFSTSGGTSDARFVKNYCSLVEFGLLSEQAHKVNENTQISDLRKLYDVYYNFLVELLAKK